MIFACFLTGCATDPLPGASFEQRMMVYDRLRLQPIYTPFYPMIVPQYPVTCFVNGQFVSCQ